MISKASTMLLAVGLVLVGCGGKKDSAPQTNASPATLMNSPKPSGPVPALAAAAQKSALPTLPKPDFGIPLASYADLNGEPAGMALTYIVSAKSQDALSDEEKLNRLSPRYYRETDVFKKKDLAAAELPRIEATLDEYRKHDYYALPASVSWDANKPLGLQNVSVGQYDFNTKSFPLSGYGGFCWASTGGVRNQQGATLKILPSDFPCNLPVPDEAQAKLIEAARAKNALSLQGTLYLYVPRVEDGTAVAVISHAHLELINTQIKASLANFDF
ncbi:MAG: hypothetical protein FWD62_10790 [Betaproteobacteria bacterium]|nr:hypothetical protein [Betaproteobacteria bacterium]